MEAPCAVEAVELYQVTLRHIPEDASIHRYCRANLRYYVLKCVNSLYSFGIVTPWNI
jgi:hypothetical protein